MVAARDAGPPRVSCRVSSLWVQYCRDAILKQSNSTSVLVLLELLEPNADPIQSEFSAPGHLTILYSTVITVFPFIYLIPLSSSIKIDLQGWMRRLAIMHSTNSMSSGFGNIVELKAMPSSVQ